mgnify:CR=1 FL=1
MSDPTYLLVDLRDKKTLQQLVAHVAIPYKEYLAGSKQPNDIALWTAIKDRGDIYIADRLATIGHIQIAPNLPPFNQLLNRIRLCIDKGALFVATVNGNVIGHAGYEIRTGKTINIDQTEYKPSDPVAVMRMYSVYSEQSAIGLIDCMLSHARENKVVSQIAFVTNSRTAWHPTQLIKNHGMGISEANTPDGLSYTVIGLNAAQIGIGRPHRPIQQRTLPYSKYIAG